MFFLIKKLKETKLDFDFKFDQYGKLVIIVDRKDSTRLFIEFSQMSDKSYHSDILPQVLIPASFYNQYVRSLKYEDRLAYLRNPTNLNDRNI
jgi:hypothetical protein